MGSSFAGADSSYHYIKMTTKQYLLVDHPQTLFPLNTTHVLVSECFDALADYVYQKVLNQTDINHFLPQSRCNASKNGLHLRRTTKLDPVAEVFIYDLVYRNRHTFRPDFGQTRRSFGYRFREGFPVPLTESYSQFRQAILEANAVYRYAACFDISSYFNSVYHHDLVQWFNRDGRSLDDANNLGQFLRETNSGRSLDCLPQGLHPCKLIGAEFLKFIDNSNRVRSELFLRFMDDFYLFSDDEDTVSSDFLTIQQILGEKGLSINAEKTNIGAINQVDVRREVNEIRAGLLLIRRQIILASAMETEPNEVEVFLNPEQVDYLLDLLREPNIDEADADLVLTLLRDHGTDVLERMETLLERFPSLSRKVFNYCPYVADRTELAHLILRFLTNGRHVTEDQLFWAAKITEDFLSDTEPCANILSRLYEHPNATEISQAKLLEIPEHRFGMPELREEQLRTGRSDWSAWAAAVGCRNEQPLQRNHKLGYFAHCSSMNALIAECVHNL